MPFNSETGSKAGKISKRGAEVPIEMRGKLHNVINQIINDLDYAQLNNNQKIKLLDICLKHTLPKIEKPEFAEPLEMQKLEILFVDGFTDEVITVNRDEFGNMK